MRAYLIFMRITHGNFLRTAGLQESLLFFEVEDLTSGTFVIVATAKTTTLVSRYDDRVVRVDLRWIADGFIAKQTTDDGTRSPSNEG